MALGASLPEGGWNTVAGLAVGLLGRLLDVGDEVTTNCCRLRVTVVRGRRVRRLAVQRLDS